MLQCSIFLKYVRTFVPINCYPNINVLLLPLYRRQKGITLTHLYNYIYKKQHDELGFSTLAYDKVAECKDG